jgi:hypothetical protein
VIAAHLGIEAELDKFLSAAGSHKKEREINANANANANANKTVDDSEDDDDHNTDFNNSETVESVEMVTELHNKQEREAFVKRWIEPYRITHYYVLVYFMEFMLFWEISMQLFINGVYAYGSVSHKSK